MAKIFLSYARDDAARAGRIANALENAGHDVWWDREIAAGSSFSNEIDTALNDAQLVVVLWSKQSIQSDWVRDEAAIGRDSGRLIPALIDDVLPPLGFRQYQAIPLMGRGRQGAQSLLKAIDRKLNREPERKRDKAQGGGFALPRTALIVGIALLLLGVIAGWWLVQPKGGGNSIVVATSGGDPVQSSDLARSLARDLGRIRAGPLATLNILDDPRAKGADYRVEVAVTGSGRQREADVALKKRGTSGLLWSGLVEDSSGNAVDMRQQVAAQVGEILTCLAELSSQERKIAESSLALYLHGCARSNDPDAINVLKDLTRREPRFGPGWANLALAAAWRVETSIAADRPGLVAQAKAALARAKALSPDLPETAVADASIIPSGGRSDARALAILDKALQRNPDSPLLRGTRAAYLQSLGRMEESVAESARALDLNPLSPELLNIRALYLAYAGRPDAALSELEKAERIWPGSERIASARFALDLRFGDPRRAMEYLDRASATLMPKDIQTYRDFLAARAEPTPANVDRALSHYRDRYERDFAAVPGFLQALVIFGRVDDAYEVAAPDVAADSLSAGSDIFFRPYMAKFRADPRFITLAKRMGLVDAWLRTGVWPDFCREPGLPYDCKAEASRLRGVRDVSEAATILK